MSLILTASVTGNSPALRLSSSSIAGTVHQDRRSGKSPLRIRLVEPAVHPRHTLDPRRTMADGGSRSSVPGAGGSGRKNSDLSKDWRQSEIRLTPDARRRWHGRHQTGILSRRSVDSPQHFHRPPVNTTLMRRRREPPDNRNFAVEFMLKIGFSPFSHGGSSAFAMSRGDTGTST
jgi:hypothetical protein